MPIWNGKFSTEREEQLTRFLWWCARLFWLVKFVQLLSKCPSQTKLCQERSDNLYLRIPAVMLFQTACSIRASLAWPDRFRQERTVVCGQLPGDEGMEYNY